MQNGQCGGRRRTAAEAGWHLSRYNVSAAIPGTDRVAIANLYKGTCAEYGELEQYLLSVLDELDERHPFIARFAERGLIADFDERAALEAMARMACAYPEGVGLTICPTMGCNFDCPYCFERHRPGRMAADVQDDVVALAGRLLEASGARRLRVTWFGGEPLLAPDVIESLSGRLVDLARRYHADYAASIITNGYLLTPGVATMLGAAKVTSAQVTLDGIGATHDATRHLATGDPTFGRIVEHLSQPGLPLKVEVRHNLHEGNLGEADRLRALVADIARTSGNRLAYRPAAVSRNQAFDERETRLRPLCDSGRQAVMLDRAAEGFSAGRGHYCAAHSIWHVGIDDCGRLHKCWEAVGYPELSFGTARDWDPADPLGSAARPDLLTAFLNTAGAIDDWQCRECVWLPACRGGCPYQRLFAHGRRCHALRDHPERYVLALHARIREKRGTDVRPDAYQ